MKPTPESPIQVAVRALLKNNTTTTDFARSELFLTKLQSSSCIQYLQDLLFTHRCEQMTLLSTSDLESMFDEYIKEGIIPGTPAFETLDSTILQRGLAITVWKAIHDRKAAGDFNYLFLHAYLTLITRIEASARERKLFAHEKKLHSTLMTLPDKSTEQGHAMMRHLAEMPIGPPYAEPGSNLFTKLSAEIVHEMFGVLLRLPHLDMVKGPGNSDPIRN